ncbi:MAG: B12-binding domain-containing radical SAM protein, partial [Nanoarchaeota archaeon]|nr:B12-binding domain-containing radical SAM protein [Nanoarchaeota archaeon]
DLGVIGEGDQTMLEIMQHFEKTGEVKSEKIDGIVYHSGNGVKFTSPRKLIEPLDYIPILDRSFISPKYYEPIDHWTGERYITSSTLTSRGCMYKCRFCASAAFWQTIRFHSAEHVVDEFEILNKKYKVQSLFIWDDFFTAHRKRLFEILELMKQRDLIGRMKLQVQSRVDVQKDVYKILKEMGVFSVNFGLESGSDKTLGFLKKNTSTVQQNKEAVKAAFEIGLNPTGSLIFANPGEKIEDMRETLDFVDWLHQAGAQFIGFYSATPYPKTDLWEIAKERGVVSDDMDFSKLEQADLNNPILLDDDVNRYEYKKLIEKLMEKKVKYFDIHKKKWRHVPLSKKVKKAMKEPKVLMTILRHNPKLLLELLKH